MATCYRGVNGTLLVEFYLPQIARAKHYRRAVGFFSSSIFEIAWDEFVRFFVAGGRFELVCSHRFQPDDLDALIEAIGEPSRIPTIDRLEPQRTIRNRRKVLLQSAFLSGQLAIKVARPRVRTGREVYHEKLGQVTGTADSSICFEGSANESRGAYVSNFERVVTHELDSLAGREIAAQLRKLWNDDTPGLEVRSFLEALRSNWIVVGDELRWPSVQTSEITMPDEPSYQNRTAIRREVLLTPSDVKLRQYQSEAVNAWYDAGGRGILEMATGTGKTLTALSIASRLYRDAGGPLVVIIVAPLLHLVDQWIDVARSFGLKPIRCAGAVRGWSSAAQDAVYSTNSALEPLASLVVTLATFAGIEFQQLLTTLNVRTLLIVDEVHNAGSQEFSSVLPSKVSLRLGLSATPDRHGDESGTKRLKDYFGEVVYRFGIAEALAYVPPVLTPYLYQPVLVELEPDEVDEYLDLTRAIVRLVGSSDEIGDWPLAAKLLLLKRARLIAGCRGKLAALRAAMSPFIGDKYSLVYCGDSSVVLPRSDDVDSDIDTSEEVVRQIDAVTRLLGLELGMRVARYTAETPPLERRRLERDFLDGSLQALVAIRCLDEGRAFILASSTNPRQFIQRRGRVLRRAPGKERAEIFDFVVLPPLHGVDSASMESIKGLFRKEVSRVVEFAQTATNRFQALARLNPMLQEYDLQHLLLGN